MAELNQITFTIQKIKQALTGPLPGKNGQSKMAPSLVKGAANRWAMPENFKEASVLILLYPYMTDQHKSELYLALMRRPEYPGVHSGQISFPGGQRESGESQQKTALREAAEEIGTTPETVRVIGQLSSLYIPPSNFCIYPFVAFSPKRPNFELNNKEVAELIETPLSLLMNPAIQKEEVWHFDHGDRYIPFFEIFGHKVWGATAMILSEFLTLLFNTTDLIGEAGKTH